MSNGRGILQASKALITLACCAALCTLQVQSVPIDSENGGTLYLAALNEPWNGYMHGLPHADEACYRQGYRALRSHRNFRAFLSSSDQNVESIIGNPKDRELPIVNIKGEILFNSWNEMFNGDSAPFSLSSSIYSFNKKNILADSNWPEKAVWHGSSKLGERAKDAYCNSWRKHPYSPNRLGFGSPLEGGRILEEFSYSCEKPLAVLCIEITSWSTIRRQQNVHEDQLMKT